MQRKRGGLTKQEPTPRRKPKPKAIQAPPPDQEQAPESGINRDELLRVLGMVQPGLAKNDIIDQASKFIFEDGKIRTYNDDISIIHNFDIGLEGAVSSTEFYKLFKKIPDKTIEAWQDGTKFIFTGKNKEIVFNVETDIRAPKIEPLGTNSSKWNKLPDDFSEAIKNCIFSASKNMNTPEMTGIMVYDSFALSSDNYRATKMEMSDEVKVPFLIPARSCVPLIDFNVSKYYLDTNWIHFINKEKTVFSVRQLAGQYPEAIKNVFDIDGDEIELPSDMDKVLERVQELISEDKDFDKLAELELKKGMIICCGQGQVGRYTEKVKCDYSGQPMKILVPPTLLADIIRQKSTRAITDGQHLLFRADNFEHIILLAEND